MVADKKILSANDVFPFDCRKGLSCFTACCEDISIFLTPNDVMRMKNALGMSAKEFLAEYADTYVVKRTGVPLVRLRMGDDEERKCLLVRRVEGCLVYPHRPWACRMYPLDKTEEGYRLLVDSSRCHGLNEERDLTVAQWLETQGVPDHEAMDALYSEVTLSDPSDYKPDVGRELLGRLYHWCYDLEELREVLFEKGAASFLPAGEAAAPEISDPDLLVLAFKILKYSLLGGIEESERKRLLEGLEPALGR